MPTIEFRGSSFVIASLSSRTTLPDGTGGFSTPTQPSKTVSFRIWMPRGAQFSHAEILCECRLDDATSQAWLNGANLSSGSIRRGLGITQARSGQVISVVFALRMRERPSFNATPFGIDHISSYLQVTNPRVAIHYTIEEEGGEQEDPEQGQGLQSPFIGPGKTVITPGRQSAQVHVYPENCADFSGNGPLMLKPAEALITEEDNGDFSVSLTHPMDTEKRWMGLADRAILRLPAPARKSLSVRFGRSGGTLTEREEGLLTYTAQHSRGWAEMWSAPSSEDENKQKERKLTLKVKNGRTLYLLGSDTGKDSSLWYMMATDRGVTGWVLSGEVRAPNDPVRVNAQDVNPRQTRDQLFRIYDVTEDTAGHQVQVKARHIFYDLLKVIVLTPEKLTDVPAATALQMLFSYADHATPFHICTNCTGTVSGDFRGQNIVSALMEPEKGILAQLDAHLVRDNYDIYVISDITADRGVRVQHQRNLRGAKAHRSSDQMYNRIVAKIDDETTVVDDPKRPAGAEILSAYRTYDKAQGSARKQALREFKEGLAAQDFSLDVDFVLLAETARNQAYNGLQRLYMGDLCEVSLPWAIYQAAVSGYEWNAITLRYSKMTVGVTAARELMGSIASYQIRGVGTTKLLGQLVSSQIGDQEIRTRHLRAGSVTTEKLEAGSITTEKLSAGAVTAEKISAGAVTADKLDAASVTAEKLAAGSVSAEHLAAAAIDAVLAQIAQANIDWANIATLRSTVADISAAQIASADIDWAQVKDLVSRRAIITQGETGELYVARLAVTEANLLSLSVGEIMVRGEDGGFYALTVDDEGNVAARRKRVENDDVQDASIFGDEKLVEGSVTARTLAAQEIFGENALIRQLIADTLDVDRLFAREALITRLNAVDITGNESIRLFVQNQEEMSAYLRITADGLEIGREDDAARFRADNRTLEVTNVKTERLAVAQAMGLPEEWVLIAAKSGLGIKYVG